MVVHIVGAAQAAQMEFPRAAVANASRSTSLAARLRARRRRLASNDNAAADDDDEVADNDDSNDDDHDDGDVVNGAMLQWCVAACADDALLGTHVVALGPLDADDAADGATVETDQRSSQRVARDCLVVAVDVGVVADGVRQPLVDERRQRVLALHRSRRARCRRSGHPISSSSLSSSPNTAMPSAVACRCVGTTSGCACCAFDFATDDAVCSDVRRRVPRAALRAEQALVAGLAADATSSEHRGASTDADNGGEHDERQQVQRGSFVRALWSFRGESAVSGVRVRCVSRR